jgi:hypothetical protein
MSQILADNGATSGVPGLKYTSDSTGQLQLQSTTSAGAVVTAQTIDNNQNSTFVGVNTPNTFGFKNRLINGAMGIWQRGTSGFSTYGIYCADRWIINGGSSITVAQSTDVPTGYKYSVSVTGSGYVSIGQRIESLNTTDLSGASVTVSFWAKQTTGAGTNALSVTLYYPTATDNYGSVTTIGTVNVTTTSSWAQYTATFTGLPSGVTNGLFPVIGSNVSGSVVYEITGVQLEKGTIATSFDYRDYGRELIMCQRYYQLYSGVWGSAGSTTGIYSTFQFPVTMRAAPTASLSGALAMTYPGVSGQTQSSASISVAASSSTTSGFYLFPNFSGLTTGNPWCMNGNTQYVQLSAEL